MIVGNRISNVLPLAPKKPACRVCPTSDTASHRKSGVRTDRPPQPFSFPQVSVMLTVKELGFDGDPLAVLSGSAIQPTVARDTPEMLI